MITLYGHVSKCNAGILNRSCFSIPPSTTASNFYAGRSNEDDDGTHRFSMMKADCRVLLANVADGLVVDKDADLHQQMKQEIAQLLLAVSDDLEKAGFRFMAAEAETVSKRIGTALWV